MLTGRFQLAAPGTKLADEDRGRPRVREPRPDAGLQARALDAWRAVAPGGRCPAGGPLSRPDADGQGLSAAGRASTGRCPGWDPTRWAPRRTIHDLTLEVWRERIRRHPGELKNLLRNQAFVAGIGNAYSDEVLHAARLLPFRKRSSLAAEEVDALYDGMRTTLAHAIDVLRERVPPTFETQVRDFLAVHMKGGQPCPRCGTRITEVKAGGFVTSYCRGCQR